MTIPFGALITGAAQARGSYLGGQQQGQQDALSRALLLAHEQQQAKQEALAQALAQSQINERNAQIEHLKSQSLGQWGPPFSGEDENGPGLFHEHKITGTVERVKVGGGQQPTVQAGTPKVPTTPTLPPDSQDIAGERDDSQKLAAALQTPPQQGLRPIVKPTAPLLGSPQYLEAQRALAKMHAQTDYHPPQTSTNVYLPSVDPVTGQTVYSVGQSKGAPNIKQTETLKPQGTGGLSTGSQTSIADMEQRLSEIKQHAANLAQGKGTITRPMQMREGLEYGIANASAGGHGVPLLPTAQAAAMDALKIGGGPGNKDYDEYAALMNSQRALGDDAAKVFKGRQNEDAVKREIALASLQPGDYKNPQVVEQKLTRMQNIIDLAKVTQPRTGSMAGGAGRGGQHPVVSKYGITPPP